MGFHFPDILHLLSSSPNLFPTDFLSCQRAERREINKAYLWPRSKVWMRACKQTFKPPRLKSQICFIYLLKFVCFTASQIRSEQISFFTFSIHASISFSGVSNRLPPVESNCTSIPHTTLAPAQAFFISLIT